MINTKRDGSRWESDWMENLVVLSEDHGGNLLIKRLGGNNEFSLNITHCDIGTDNTTPADSDTQLGNARARSVPQKTDESSNSVTFQTFYPDGILPNDTYREFGAFIDGSSTIDSGQLWNRLLLSVDYEKATGEDTTVILELSVSN